MVPSVPSPTQGAWGRRWGRGHRAAGSPSALPVPAAGTRQSPPAGPQPRPQRDVTASATLCRERQPEGWGSVPALAGHGQGHGLAAPNAVPVLQQPGYVLGPTAGQTPPWGWPKALPDPLRKASAASSPSRCLSQVAGRL